MPTKATTQRIITNLENPLYKLVIEAAHREQVSISQKVRDFIQKAIELEEDAALETLVMERKRRGGRFLSHGEFWKKAGVR